jgi:hypothetical protein
MQTHQRSGLMKVVHAGGEVFRGERSENRKKRVVGGEGGVASTADV